MTTATVDSEEQLITRAQEALSSCNWVIGECASQWTERYGKGRTDSDFGSMIGLSGDQVFQRRRVWETFADVHQAYPSLKWSHFYVAINWDDASECLQWANEMEATIAEMKAWRRANNGEDLTEPAAELTYDIAPDYLSVGAGMVRDPSDYEAADGARSVTALMAPESGRPEMAASANREAGSSDYTPFGAGARGPAEGKEKSAREDQTSQQILERSTKLLEKVVESISPSVLEDFDSLSIELQQRFLDAIENLQAKTAGIT